MLDRLDEFLKKAELKGYAQDESIRGEARQQGANEEGGSASNLAKEAEAAVGVFQKRCDLVERSITQMERATIDLREIRQELQTAVMQSEEQQLTEKYSSIVKSITPAQKVANDNLKLMQHEIEDNEEKFEKEPALREMKQLHYSVVQRLKRVVQEYFEQQVQFRNQERDKIKSKVRVVQQNISEEQLEELADDPEAAAQLIQQQIKGKVHFQVANAVKDIEMRHSAIVELTDSIQELNRMFADVQLLVQAQGETINTVKQLVNNAHNYLREGHKNLKEAKRQHLRAQRCKCYILICVLVLLFIILFPVILTQAL